MAPPTFPHLKWSLYPPVSLVSAGMILEIGYYAKLSAWPFSYAAFELVHFNLNFLVVYLLNLH